MYGYIYITTNLINGKKYIGKHKSKYFNPNYKGSGKYLRRAINKYGWDNFKVELVKECYSKDELDNSERIFILESGAQFSNMYYNIAPGGLGGFGSGENSPRYNKIPYNRGKSMSDEQKLKISKSETGKVLSKETKDKISKSVSGSNNPFYGKHHTEETKSHLSQVHTGKVVSQYVKDKISKSMKGKKFPNRKYRLVCKSCGLEFLGNCPTSKLCNNCKRR